MCQKRASVPLCLSRPPARAASPKLRVTLRDAKETRDRVLALVSVTTGIVLYFAWDAPVPEYVLEHKLAGWFLGPESGGAGVARHAYCIRRR
jgi:hypothetical protein